MKLNSQELFVVSGQTTPNIIKIMKGYDITTTTSTISHKILGVGSVYVCIF